MTKQIIAVVGGTGAQGGGVAEALLEGGRFAVRVLTRNPSGEKARALSKRGAEVVQADLNSPETLKSAFKGAYGVFAVTNFWEKGGADEVAQGGAAVRAAQEAGVRHFVWSTLPNVETISGGKYNVPHFTDKARVDAIVKNAGFEHHTFVIASFFYQNLLGILAPQKQQDGSLGWTLPIDPSSRSIHMGDIAELGAVVAGAFAYPDKAGDGQCLPLVGEFLSFNEVVETLNKQGHTFTFNQVPREVFANFFDGARELAEMFGYFEDHTYLGANSDNQIALAHEIAGKPATDFATWALSSMPSKSR
jgi:uncharacterized protein YbjT (DUF2867 family)